MFRSMCLLFSAAAVNLCGCDYFEKSEKKLDQIAATTASTNEDVKSITKVLVDQNERINVLEKKVDHVEKQNAELKKQIKAPTQLAKREMRPDPPKSITPTNEVTYVVERFVTTARPANGGVHLRWQSPYASGTYLDLYLPRDGNEHQFECPRTGLKFYLTWRV